MWTCYYWSNLLPNALNQTSGRHVLQGIFLVMLRPNSTSILHSIQKDLLKGKNEYQKRKKGGRGSTYHKSRKLVLQSAPKVQDQRMLHCLWLRYKQVPKWKKKVPCEPGVSHPPLSISITYILHSGLLIILRTVNIHRMHCVSILLWYAASILCFISSFPLFWLPFHDDQDMHE